MNVRDVPNFNIQDRDYTSLRLQLGQKKTLTKFEEYSLLDVGTEIGSLIAILFTLGYILNSIYGESLETLQKMERIYKVHMPDDLTFSSNAGYYKEPRDKLEWLKQSQSMKMTVCDKFWITVCFQACQRTGRELRLKQLMRRARQKLNKSLDIKNIIETQCNLSTLIHLKTSHDQRKMFALQRRHRILDSKVSEGSESLEDDRKLIRDFMDFSNGYF